MRSGASTTPRQRAAAPGRPPAAPHPTTPQASGADAGIFAGASKVWPLTAICLGMPLWFLLGGAAVVWSIPALVLGLDLIRRRALRMPPAAGVVLALLGWIALSGLQIRGVQAMALFAYRFSIFASMAALYLWHANAPERMVPTRTIVRLLGAFWIVMMVFGYLAILLPEVSVPGLLQRLLPGAIRSDTYVRDLTSIKFAEAQGWLGYLVPRPAAPMAYSNGWGSTFGILTPFFVLGWVIDPPRGRRALGCVLLLLGVVPAIISMNRGLWLSMGLVAAFVAMRNLYDGKPTIALRVLAVGSLLVALVVFTPLGVFVQDKLGGAEDSNETRSSLYEGALSYAAESPLLGYGAPVQDDSVHIAVGTHGLIWYLMVAHGYPAMILFGAWVAVMLRHALPLRSPTGIWTAAAVLVFAFQMPIYGLLPQLALAGVLAALVDRERTASAIAARGTQRGGRRGAPPGAPLPSAHRR